MRASHARPGLRARGAGLTKRFVRQARLLPAQRLARPGLSPAAGLKFSRSAPRQSDLRAALSLAPRPTPLPLLLPILTRRQRAPPQDRACLRRVDRRRGGARARGARGRGARARARGGRRGRVRRAARSRPGGGIRLCGGRASAGLHARPPQPHFIHPPAPPPRSVESLTEKFAG